MLWLTVLLTAEQHLQRSHPEESVAREIICVQNSSVSCIHSRFPYLPRLRLLFLVLLDLV